MSDHNPPLPSAAELETLEAAAVELARRAGQEIANAFCQELRVEYKGGDNGPATDPVSEVDHRVETLIREQLSRRFPDHGIIGEEQRPRPGPDSAFVWAVDPVDGTANFVHGFPLFAAALGILHRGRPVAGAIWCATGHALRPGVYHARANGPLCFDGRPLAPRRNPQARRRLVGHAGGRDGGGWYGRHSGSACLDGAFTAAGLLYAARFRHPHLWDVAAGAALVLAAGGQVQVAREGRWQPLEAFEPLARDWCRPVIMGHPDAVARMAREKP
ncbi:MAG: inositol monophosphatase family protein [Candidatus Competibacteraceae bacterium]|nr:inositol monophosphatase family protein [Candidatus Competibacteraceae bacterium]